MTFKDDLRRFSAKLETRSRDVFTGVVDLAHESITEGSPVTGAPGQPVDTGVLKASWVKSYPDENTAEISTNVEYAPYIEDGGNSRGEFTLRSEVGGFHSVALTVAAFPRIVEAVTASVVGSDA